VISNNDTEFKLSPHSVRQLHNDARTAGLAAQRVFRDKAHFLRLDPEPRFSLSGEELTSKYHVGIHPSLYRDLQAVAERMGVPEDTIGELIVSYIVPEQAAV
jgi:hypothetical protein